VAEEEEDEADTWVVVEEVEAGAADEVVAEEVRFLDTFIDLCGGKPNDDCGIEIIDLCSDSSQVETNDITCSCCCKRVSEMNGCVLTTAEFVEFVYKNAPNVTILSVMIIQMNVKGVT